MWQMFGSAAAALGSAALNATGKYIEGRNASANASDQMAMQREFAQNGIRWRVADAKAAGIHPLAALGAQTFSYNPVMTGDNGVGSALSAMGQGIDRAREAKQLEKERAANDVIRGLQIEGLKLDNQRKAQQIKHDEVERAYRLADRVVATQQQVPAMPIVNDRANGGPASSTPGVKPFWEHFRNFDWITPVPSGDLKDYVSENMLISLASQLAYAQSAWNGQVKPDYSALTERERVRYKAGLSSPRYYPFMGWRMEPTLRHFLLNALPVISPNGTMNLVRSWRKK